MTNSTGRTLEETRRKKWAEHQSLLVEAQYLERVNGEPGRVARIWIRRNAYDFQSYAHVDVIGTNGESERLFTQPMNELGIFSHTYVNGMTDAARHDADGDIDFMADTTATVLGCRLISKGDERQCES